MKILLLNGPNLALLGVREPEIYGHDTLESIVESVRNAAAAEGCEVIDYQSDVEGFLVERIGKALKEGIDGIIFNPAAYTHTSIAISDALAAVRIPTVEVHLSNVFHREGFRHQMVTSGQCIGIVAGFGADSYVVALDALLRYLKKRK